MISFKHRGSFAKIEKFLHTNANSSYLKILNKYGEEGVAALAQATPKSSGKTASSWKYEIVSKSNSTSISWFNTNVNQNVNIAVILQYGHGTGTGGFVSGRDYINPAMAPVFDRIADEAWREITK